MLIRALLDRLLPGACLLCGGVAVGSAVCAACAADLPRLVGPQGAQCARCATPLTSPAPACGACLRIPPAFDATCAVWRYHAPLDQLILALKFRHRLASADFLAAGMLAGPHPDGDVIVPVPLAAARLAERGFNQALELARPLARALGLPLDVRRLVRNRSTLPQSRLPWRARARNVRHAFECRGDFNGRHVIVVDDVMTSGATLDAVARTLKDHGAISVSNWVAARAVKIT